MKKHQELCFQYAAEEMQELIRREKEAWFLQVDEDRRAQQQFYTARMLCSRDRWPGLLTPYPTEWR